MNSTRSSPWTRGTAIKYSARSRDSVPHLVFTPKDRALAITPIHAYASASFIQGPIVLVEQSDQTPPDIGRAISWISSNQCLLLAYTYIDVVKLIWSIAREIRIGYFNE